MTNLQGYFHKYDQVEDYLSVEGKRRLLAVKEYFGNKQNVLDINLNFTWNWRNNWGIGSDNGKYIWEEDFGWLSDSEADEDDDGWNEEHVEGDWDDLGEGQVEVEGDGDGGLVGEVLQWNNEALQLIAINY